MARIYALETDGLIWYVGSTAQSAGQRMREHRCRKDTLAGSYDIPLEYEWQLVVLEECSKDDRYTREAYWYEKLKPLYNKRHPPSSRKEVQQRYVERNRDRVRERSRLWALADRQAKRKSSETLCPR